MRVTTAMTAMTVVAHWLRRGWRNASRASRSRARTTAAPAWRRLLLALPRSVARQPPASTGQRWGEAGQAIVWAAVMMPAFLAVLGLALDAGVVFNARRELQHVAAGAAHAGATQIDHGRYRQAATVALDPRRAEQAAAEYVAAQAGLGIELEAVAADQRQVVVTVGREVGTSFLRIVRIPQVRVRATAPAEVRHGIAGAIRD